MRKIMNSFAVGAGVGYVLGARAGRGEYDRMVAWWNRATGPMVQRISAEGRAVLRQASRAAAARAREVPVARAIADRVDGLVNGDERIADVMTATVETVQPSRT